jgi:hypothetical protein
MKNLLGRIWAFVKTLKQPPRLLLAVALLGVFTMFATNTDWGGDSKTPRGDGKYRPVLARGDGHMSYLMLRSFVLDQDLVFDNDLKRFGDPWRQRKTKTGRKDIPHPIGPVIVWSPVMVGAHGMSKVANLFGADIESHGYTMFHHRIVFGTSVLFAFFAVLFGCILARRLFGGRWGPVYAAVCILYGTTITYYATYMPSYGHAMDAFLCAAFLLYWAMTYGDLRWRRYIYMGLLLGLCALVRVQDLAMGIVVAIEVVALSLGAVPEGQTRARFAGMMLARGAVTLGMAIVAFTPQLIAWKLVYGEFLTSPNGPRYVRLRHPMVSELLFSSRNGWLSTHPLAYAGLVGLAFVPKKARIIGFGLAMAVFMQIWVNASVLDWWSSASFGQRRMASVTICLVVGLAALLHAGNIAARKLPAWSRHIIAVVVLGWFVAWNIAQVQPHRRGKAAGRGVGPSCCKRVPKPLAKVAKPIYDVVGNPFTFPANAMFALKYGTDLKRWDNAVGDYVFVPPWYEYNDGRYKKRMGKWNIPSPSMTRYVISGLGPPQKYNKMKRGYRWTTSKRAEVLVPILLPEAHRFKMRTATNSAKGDPPQTVSWYVNGVKRHTQELAPGWHDVQFNVPLSGINVGNNVVAVEAELAPHRTGENTLKPLPKGGDVGVAFGAIWVGFPR